MNVEEQKINLYICSRFIRQEAMVLLVLKGDVPHNRERQCHRNGKAADSLIGVIIMYMAR